MGSGSSEGHSHSEHGGKVCPFRGSPCINPSWADCQFEFSGGEKEYADLWLAGKDGGRNCKWLPEGISRTQMLECLGAFGEREKNAALQRLRKKVEGRGL